MEYLAGIIIAIPLGLIPAIIAKKKGHSFGLWWLYGWALFIVAIIHVQFIEDYNKVETKNSYTPYNPSQTYVPQQNNSYSTPTYYQPQASSDTADELKKYKNLLDEGVISQEDYDAKKKQLLGL